MATPRVTNEFLDKRVSRVEEELGAISSNVNRMSTIMGSMQSDVKNLTQSVKEGLEGNHADIKEIKAQNRPNTGLLLGGLSVFISVTALIGGVIAFAIFTPMNMANVSQDKRLDALEAEALRHHERELIDSYENGKRDERISRLNKS